MSKKELNFVYGFVSVGFAVLIVAYAIVSK